MISYEAVSVLLNSHMFKRLIWQKVMYTAVFTLLVRSYSNSTLTFMKLAHTLVIAQHEYALETTGESISCVRTAQ